MSNQQSEKPQVNLCRHVFANGEICRAIAVRWGEYCHWHFEARMRKEDGEKQVRWSESIPGLTLPLIEDPHALQQAIVDTLNAIVDGRLGSQKGKLMLYGLQLALSNVHHLQRLEPAGKRTLSSCTLWSHGFCKKRRSGETEAGTCNPCEFLEARSKNLLAGDKPATDSAPSKPK